MEIDIRRIAELAVKVAVKAINFMWILGLILLFIVGFVAALTAEPNPPAGHSSWVSARAKSFVNLMESGNVPSKFELLEDGSWSITGCIPNNPCDDE